MEHLDPFDLLVVQAILGASDGRALYSQEAIPIAAIMPDFWRILRWIAQAVTYNLRLTARSTGVEWEPAKVQWIARIAPMRYVRDD